MTLLIKYAIMNVFPQITFSILKAKIPTQKFHHIEYIVCTGLNSQWPWVAYISSHGILLNYATLVTATYYKNLAGYHIHHYIH